MFVGLWKPKFYVKCKSSIKLTKCRLESVRQKKNSVIKYLRNDIADLLKSRLDYNAFGRTEGLLNEQKRLSCYDFIEQFYGSISSQLTILKKQRECPEECREAVSSLIYAAARVSEIPELRDLRTLFTDRYGSTLEIFVNREFAETFSADVHSKETKLQLMNDIAQQYAIEWDQKALEQRLFTRPKDELANSTPQGRSSSMNNEKNVLTTHRRRNSSDDKNTIRRNSNDDKIYPITNGERSVMDEKRSSSTSQGRRSLLDEKNYSSSIVKCPSENEAAADSSKNQSMQNEAAADSSKNQSMQNFNRPPYTKQIGGKNGNLPDEHKSSSSEVNAQKDDDPVAKLKPKPISVRRRFVKPSSLSSENAVSQPEIDNADKMSQSWQSGGNNDVADEKTIRNGKKIEPKSPSSLGKKTNSMNSATGGKDGTFAFSSPRRSSCSPERRNETMSRHNRASSIQSEGSSTPNVHPKLPEYDDLASRLAALKG